MSYKILTIDDDDKILELITNILKLSGYEVYLASDGRQGLRRFREVQPDLILLDVMMPELSGWEVCERIRQVDATPIIMLTAKDDPADVIKGLSLGADDYVNKPFHPEVLQARVQAVLRRSQGDSFTEPKTEFDFLEGHLRIQTEQHRVYVDDRPVSLSPREYNLLTFMANHPGIVLTNEKIFENVWSYDSDAEVENVKWYIWRLRKKIERNPSDPELILTERGIGYRFMSD